MSIWFFVMPNQAFARTQQFRLSKTIKSEAANIEIGVSAQRPPQRDSEFPDFQGGVKIGVNSWKGVHTIGSGYPSLDPLTIAVSGTTRQFRVNEFAAVPTTTHTASGWDVSLDAMLPLIPATAKSKGNALTLTGSFTTGSGYSDLIGGLSGGAAFPNLPAIPPGQATPFTAANIDPGIVQYDTMGNLRTLNWRTFMAGIQYYLPPNGRVTIGANYTQGDSDNITENLAAPGSVFKRSQFFEAVALGDITPAVRAGVAWQRSGRRAAIDRNREKPARAGGVFLLPSHEDRRCQGHRAVRAELRHPEAHDRGRDHRPRRRHPERPRARGGELSRRPRDPAADRARRAADRGHLALPVQGRVLARRPGDDDGDRRGRHRAVGHPGQGARRAGAPAARRPGARQRDGLRPRQRSRHRRDRAAAARTSSSATRRCGRRLPSPG
jgi:hypothetical protein